MLGNRQRGQAAVEFSLVLPVLIFTILGIVELGRALFTYAQVADAQRDALRQAEILGYEGGSPPYLDCDAMIDRAQRVYFTTPSVSIQYVKADKSLTYTCDDVVDAVLETGDIVEIDVTAPVNFLFFPFADLNLNFEG